MEAKDYRDSHMRPGKGESYERAFVSRPYRRFLWSLEQRCLDEVISVLLRRSGRLRHLDFACGTGRVLEYVSSWATSSVGVDVSPSMLEIARRKGLRAQWVEADLTRLDVLGDRRFDLITAFRFLSNAQQDLRASALAVLTRHLDRGGFLVVNNHRNRGSLLYFKRRVRDLISGERGVSSDLGLGELRGCIEKARLVPVRTWGLGLLPYEENHPVNKGSALSRIEGALRRRRFARNLSQDIVMAASFPPAGRDAIPICAGFAQGMQPAFDSSPEGTLR